MTQANLVPIAVYGRTSWAKQISSERDERPLTVTRNVDQSVCQIHGLNNIVNIVRSLDGLINAGV